MADEPWATVSQVMGMSSVLIWLCAQLPQVCENYRLKSVEGLSFGFLVAWFAGDITNLIGCIFTGQLGFQTVLACYYVAMDACLGVQFWLYRQQSCVDEEITPMYTTHIQHLHRYHDIPGETANLNRRNSATKTLKTNLGRARRRLSSLLSLATLLGAFGRASAMPISNAALYNNKMALREDIPSVGLEFGYCMAYFSTVMYLASRVPQIWHNFRRKSTDGVSTLLFTSALLGNLTYTLSIILSPQAMTGDHPRDFFLKELSYIVGAAGTIVFDVVILCQSVYYKKSKDRRGSDDEVLIVVTEVIDAQPPTRRTDPDIQRLRELMRRKSSDKTPLLSHHSETYR